MCGIGGILRTDGQPIPEEWLDAIDARIAYRGPDGHGRFRDRVEIADSNAPGGAGKRVVEVAFVHRRLSIIDHKDGAQPMVSERGRNDKEGLVAVVFNGCIYNHRDLRKELEAKGHKFVTDHSDTEVLIHGWREWGSELSTHLEGMYAWAIWDRSNATLALSRDWFGEKPLFTRRNEQPIDNTQRVVGFCSDAAILTKTPGLEPRLDDQALMDWTARYLQTGAPSTFPAFGGTIETVWPDDTELWDSFLFDENFGSRPGPREQATGVDFASLLDRAVARRLEADVPLGVFLSGGIDSSLVACFAKRHDAGIRTFAVRMPDARFDESPFAKLVAEHLGTTHTTLDISAQPAEDLVRLVTILGQPFGDSSILPTHWVSVAAREHVKVALSGDGGDELFFGYERYSAARVLAKSWRWLRHLPVGGLHRAHTKSRLNKLARLRDMARDYPQLGLECMESIFTCEQIEALTDRPYDNQTALFPTINPPEALREDDLSDYLPNDLLRKVDTASMACGLEVRCPFLDRDLARAALAAPIEQLMPGGQRKGLLRQIARKYLPKEIVDRPKMGFAIPIGEWFRSDYGGMKTLLLDHLNSAEPFGPTQLNRKAVQRFIDEHMTEKRDHGQRLFTLLTLSIWARQIAR
jgi:asparagine synthase (glutamine-hydrolysing)